MWGDGEASEWYYRGSLCLEVAKQIYCSPSEVLLNHGHHNEVLVSRVVVSFSQFSTLLNHSSLLLQHHHYVMTLLNCVRDASIVIDQQAWEKRRSRS